MTRQARTRDVSLRFSTAVPIGGNDGDVLTRVGVADNAPTLKWQPGGGPVGATGPTGATGAT
jgi:hypothetical protein